MKEREREGGKEGNDRWPTSLSVESITADVPAAVRAAWWWSVEGGGGFTVCCLVHRLHLKVFKTPAHIPSVAENHFCQERTVFISPLF